MEKVIATRKTSAKELEHKLKKSLEEPRCSRDLVKKLQQKRDNTEEEIENVAKRNIDLKGKLADLHTNYLDIVAQRDHLRNIVTAFNQCSNEHKRALDGISVFETNLMQARISMLELENGKLNIENQRTHSLYGELGECNSQPIQPTQSELIIDKTTNLEVNAQIKK